MSGTGTAAVCTGVDNSSLLIDRRALVDLGGFQPALGPESVDVELSLRILNGSGAVIVSRAVELLTEEEYREGTLDWRIVHQAGESTRPPSRRTRSMRRTGVPRIALLTDVRGWAFDNIAKQIVKHLGDDYQFDVIPVGDVGGVRRALILSSGADLIHFLWRELPHELFGGRFSGEIAEIGLSDARFLAQFVRGRATSTTIYDHLWSTVPDLEVRAPTFERLSAYSVASRRLFAQYSNTVAGLPPPACVTQDGVDLDRFTVHRRPRSNDAPLVIGWAGNSLWGDPKDDVKGLRTILRPALDRLRDEGFRFEEVIVDRKDGLIPHESMPSLYRRMDLLVITSSMEGTPNPLLEAMATGLAVVTTDVGVAPEAFGDRQREFIVKERTVDAIAQALRRLLRDPALVQELGEENLVSIRAWGWSIRAQGYRALFEAALAGDPVLSRP